MAHERIRVVCVDDHPIVLEGLRSVLSAAGDIDVVATGSNGRQAIELFERHRPDVSVLDLRMPVLDGVDAVRGIRHASADARIIILTTYKGDEDIYRALQAGAITYILKETLADDLVRVVRQVHAGECPVPQEVAASLVSRVTHPSLTRRERDVLCSLAKGLRNKEISAELGITEETVQVHMKNILAKLNVHDRTEAVIVALRRGIIHLE
jgi:two-component system NarL family response regulator